MACNRKDSLILKRIYIKTICILMRVNNGIELGVSEKVMVMYRKDKGEKIGLCYDMCFDGQFYDRVITKGEKSLYPLRRGRGIRKVISVRLENKYNSEEEDGSLGL